MTPLRAKMIRELALHRKAPKTIEAYVTAVAQLGKFYGRSPEKISLEEIRDFVHHLITVQKVAYSTCNQKLAGIRFFYREVLGEQDFQLRIPAKRSGRLPEPLSRSEIARLLEATSNTKHRMLLMTTYGGGLRVSEVVRLKPRDIHAERMLIRVEQGKGHKDRYTLLSPRLLEELRADRRPLRSASAPITPQLPGRRCVRESTTFRQRPPIASRPTARLIQSPSSKPPAPRLSSTGFYPAGFRSPPRSWRHLSREPTRQNPTRCTVVQAVAATLARG